MKYSITRFVISALVLLTLGGCVKHSLSLDATKTDITTRPDVKIQNHFPVFTAGLNQAVISNSFKDADPKWVLGSVIDTKTSQVRSNDNF